MLENGIASRFLVTATSVVHELVEGAGLDMGRSLALVIMLVAVVLGGIDNLRMHQICLVWWLALIIGLRWVLQGVRRVDHQSLCGANDHRFFRGEEVQETRSKGSQVYTRLSGMRAWANY